jgi:5-methylcytosine-specific restriction endonuclease McrA
MPHKDPEQRRQYAAAYYQANRERIRASQAAYRTVDPERYAAQQAATHQRARERRLANMAAYYQEHVEQMKAASKASRLRRQHTSEYRATKRAWRAANRNKQRKSGAEWKRRNPHAVANDAAMRRARVLAATIDGLVDRVVVFERDGYVCQLCGLLTDPTGPRGERPTIDHIESLARGGAHTYGNLQTAHLRCNIEKGVGH